MLPASSREVTLSETARGTSTVFSTKVSGMRSAENAGLLSGPRTGTQVATASGIPSLYFRRALSSLTCPLQWQSQTCPYHRTMLSSLLRKHDAMDVRERQES